MCDAPQAYYDTYRKARKIHRCCECRRIIHKGELYHFASGIWAHQPGSFKTCTQCWDVWLEYSKNLRWDDCLEFTGLYAGWPHEELPEHVRTYWIERGWIDAEDE